MWCSYAFYTFRTLVDKHFYECCTESIIYCSYSVLVDLHQPVTFPSWLLILIKAEPKNRILNNFIKHPGVYFNPMGPSNRPYSILHKKLSLKYIRLSVADDYSWLYFSHIRLIRLRFFDCEHHVGSNDMIVNCLTHIASKSSTSKLIF